MLWIVIALMTGAAVLCVVWPLSKPQRAPSTFASDDLRFYQDQLRALDRDIDGGLVPAAEVPGSRAELARRLLAATDRNEAVAPAVAGRGRLRLLAIAFGTMVIVPALSLGLYLRVGAPEQGDLPLASREGAPPSNEIETAMARVESHLVMHPDDGRGFELLAPLYLRLGRYDDAVRAYERALDLLGENAVRRVGYGRALMMAADGVVTAAARQAFDTAAKDDPAAPEPQFYRGMAAAQDGNRDIAKAIWGKLVQSAPPDAPWLPMLQAKLSELDSGSLVQKGGPSTPTGAAIAALPAGQQLTAIRGMVDGLAARLAQDGHDKDGWLRLVRAYSVLGEKDRALSALADARKNLASDPQGLAELDGLAHQLGIES